MEDQKYTCPMHPEIHESSPGMCPECGMAFVPTKIKTEHKEHQTHDGHDAHAGHSTEAFLKKFWASLILSVPVVIYSDILFQLFEWSPPAFKGSLYIPAILGSIIFFYGGWIFLAWAARGGQAGAPGEMIFLIVGFVTA